MDEISALCQVLRCQVEDHGRWTMDGESLLWKIFPCQEAALN